MFCNVGFAEQIDKIKKEKVCKSLNLSKKECDKLSKNEIQFRYNLIKKVEKDGYNLNDGSTKGELYWCQYEHANLFVEEGKPWGIPVSIVSQENKIIFLKEYNLNNGEKWLSMHSNKHFFKITEMDENFYKASAPWSDDDKRRVDVTFDRKKSNLSYKFEGLDFISLFFCKTKDN